MTHSRKELPSVPDVTVGHKDLVVTMEPLIEPTCELVEAYLHSVDDVDSDECVTGQTLQEECACGLVMDNHTTTTSSTTTAAPAAQSPCTLCPSASTSAINTSAASLVSRPDQDIMLFYSSWPEEHILRNTRNANTCQEADAVMTNNLHTGDSQLGFASALILVDPQGLYVWLKSKLCDFGKRGIL